MKYNNVIRGSFVSRPNRFIAYVDIDGSVVVCHVKNTGRCSELLAEGAEVFLETSDNPQRKTKYDLVAVRKGVELYNIDSQAPNKVVGEWLLKNKLFKDITLLKPECKYKNSRFDFYAEHDGRKAFIEVKGVTLEEDGILMFPDAPTDRGIKHIKELCACVDEGYEAFVIFVVQTEKAKYFTPNRKTHPQFADVLKTASECGVNVICLNCIVKPDYMEINDYVPVKL